MIKVMLADDNNLALEYFSGLVDWNAYGFDLVCTAIDGEAAWICFKKYRPQLVITDVQMPNMDGIELARRIGQLAPETVVIFLSSYEEFSYIRSALALGVQDYILKHETKEQELVRKLQKIRSLLESRRYENRLVVEGYLTDCLSGVLQKDEAVRRVFLRNFFEQYDLRIAIQAHILPAMTHLLSAQTPELSENAVKDFFYQYQETKAVLRVAPYTYLLLSVHSRNLMEGSYRWKDDFEKQFHLSLSLLVFAENAGIEDCMSAYRNQKEEIACHSFFPVSSVLYKGMLHASKRGVGYNLEGRITDWLQRQAFSDLFHKLDQCFLTCIHAQNIEDFEDLVRQFGTVLLTYHEKIFDERTHTLFEVNHPSFQVSWQDASSVFHWLKERYTVLSKALFADPLRRYSRPVRDVCLYIYRNYRDSDLSAESIADAFGTSVNQLNAQVKRETTTTVWQLLIQIRMEKARALLDETDLRISDIGEQVGYKTISYFSNVFRKYYRVSPQEYRKSKKVTLSKQQDFMRPCTPTGLYNDSTGEETDAYHKDATKN